MQSAEEFAQTYADRSRVTVEWLKENGREVRPCNCIYEFCDGWQMAHVTHTDGPFCQCQPCGEMTHADVEMGR